MLTMLRLLDSWDRWWADAHALAAEDAREEALLFAGIVAGEDEDIQTRNYEARRLDDIAKRETALAHKHLDRLANRS